MTIKRLYLLEYLDCNPSSMQYLSIADQIYGCGLVDHQTWVSYTKLLIALCKRVRPIQNFEERWIQKELLTFLELPEAPKMEIRQFTGDNFDIDDVVDSLSFDNGFNHRKALIYDLLKMTGNDRDLAESACEELGILPHIIMTLEGLIQTEKSLEDIRKSIFELGVTSDEYGEAALNIMKETSIMVRHIYGKVDKSEDNQLNYGYALMIIAGADGIVSDEELDWFVNFFAKANSIEEGMVDKISQYEYLKGNLQETLNNIHGENPINFARTLLYNGIKMSSADGDYALEEKDAVMKAAQWLNIPSNILRTMEYLVEAEERVNSMRYALFNS